MAVSERITMEVPDGLAPAMRWLPPAGAGPGIVVFQEIFGLSDYVQNRCADLAALGYVVIAPEVYWRLDQVDIDETAADFVEQAIAVVSRVDWPQAVNDGRSAITWLRAQPQTCHTPLDRRVAAVGFCFGGGLAFNVAATGALGGEAPDCLVSYYGSALPSLTGLASTVRCPQLHHFGRDDAYIPMDQVQLIESAVTGGGLDVTFLTYPGAGHAFDNPHPLFHHTQASAQAWDTTVDWLTRHLPVD